MNTSQVNGHARGNERHGQLDDLKLQLALSERLSAGLELQPIVDETLQVALAVTDTDMGLISLCSNGAQVLDLSASAGFDAAFLASVQRVPPGGGSCGTCFERGERVIIEDTETDPLFESYRGAARQAGFRAVHSTPLVTRRGDVIGVLSTHARTPRRPSEREVHLLDLCARQAADAIENARLFRRAQEELAERRRTEAALRESQERLRQLADNLPLGFIYQITINPHTGRRFSYISGSVASVCGAGPQQVIANPDLLHGLIVPEDRELVRSAEEAAFLHLKPFECRFRIRTANGELRWLQCRSAPRLHSNGETIWDGIAIDVTDAHRVQEELAASRDQLEVILRGVADGITVQGPDGNLLFANDGAARIIGYPTAETLLATPIQEMMQRFELFDEAGQPFPINHLPGRRALAGEQNPEAVIRFRVVASGAERWSLVRATPIFHDGQVRFAINIFHDITAQKRAEQEQRQLISLVETSTDLIGLAALDARILYFNDAGLRLLGLDDAADARQRSLFDFVMPEDLPIVEKDMLPALHAVGRWEGQWRYRHVKTGAAIPVSKKVTLITDPLTGKPVAFATVSRDISERLRAEEALREADRKKDEFLALLAHELRNPLAPLRNGLQIMRLAAGDASAINQARAMMDRQLGHMVRLIDDLLDVSRISRNKLHLQRIRTPLSEVINSAVETARPSIEAAGHELIMSLPPQPVYVDADITRLAQVFSNLLTNSAKYTQPGGKIWLTATCTAGTVTVTVRDTGIGIPEKALPRIFDMFSQVDRSIERSTGGLGIGLALVKGLVEMHGGSVTAASDGPGQGSVFTVSLPVLEDRCRTAPATADDDTSAGPRRRILVVDDSRDSATSMALMLKLLGNDIRTAYDGIEAIESAATFRPELILMDIGMPRMNGLDAVRRIREQPWGDEMQIFALTGWGQDGDRQQSAAAGCDGHLVKPVSLADLQKILLALPASST